MKFTIIEVIEDLSNEAYHDRDEISSSFIKKVIIEGSVEKAIEAKENTTPNHAMLLGSAWHSYNEGEDVFNSEVAVFDDRDIMEELSEQYKSPRMTNAYKDMAQAFEERHDGKIIISHDELLQFQGMYESMKNNKWVHDNILSVPESGIRREVSYFWEYEGLKFRTRPDAEIYDFMGDLVAIPDWKSCRDALSYDKDIAKWRHDISAIMYCIPMDLHPDNFYFIATDKTEPYITKEWGLKTKTIRKAWNDFHKAIRMIKYYNETGVDPSFDTQVDRV